jgi:hypothetical protein
MRVGAPDELSAVLLAERLGRDRCSIGQQSDERWCVAVPWTAAVLAAY